MSGSVRLAEIARRLHECVAILEQASGRRPFRVPDQDNIDGAEPYYGEEDGRLFVRAQERGQLVRDEAHDDVESVVESLVTRIAVQVARAYEASNRRPREDSRRQWFHLSEVWLGRVEPAWGERLRAHHADVLASAPFDDDVWRVAESAARINAEEMDARRAARGPEPARAVPTAEASGRHVRAVPPGSRGWPGPQDHDMSSPPPAGRSTGRLAVGIILMSLGAALALCGLGILAYGGLGAVMVDQSQDDPWVVWSLVVGAVMSVLAVGAFIVGVVLLVRRR